MKLNISLDDNEKNINFSIPLLDNEYNKFLVENLDKVSKWETNSFSLPCLLHKNPTEINSLWSEIISSYERFLHLISVEDLIKPPKTFDETNHYLNLLHRAFTEYHSGSVYFNKHVDRIDEALVISEKMNEDIHLIENYVVNDRVKKWQGAIDVIEIETVKDLDLLFHLNKAEPELEQNYNVYATKHILGKDYATAFFNYDSPDALDVTNYELCYCGFMIDINGTFKKIFNDEEFKEWLGDKEVGLYPIGNISDEELNVLRESFEKNQPLTNARVKTVL